MAVSDEVYAELIVLLNKNEAKTDLALKMLAEIKSHLLSTNIKEINGEMNDFYRTRYEKLNEDEGNRIEKWDAAVAGSFYVVRDSNKPGSADL
jgi:uncharacterized protein YejL (UPF0352 family)